MIPFIDENIWVTTDNLMLYNSLKKRDKYWKEQNIDQILTPLFSIITPDLKDDIIKPPEHEVAHDSCILIAEELIQVQ